jgi:hypothetical protein
VYSYELGSKQVELPVQGFGVQELYSQNRPKNPDGQEQRQETPFAVSACSSVYKDESIVEWFQLLVTLHSPSLRQGLPEQMSF